MGTPDLHLFPSFGFSCPGLCRTQEVWALHTPYQASLKKESHFPISSILYPNTGASYLSYWNAMIATSNQMASALTNIG